ncbi:MAG TPA: hypothetical protein VLL27_01750 [Solirubrobacterales bacterium]|nr:hypothetical protein [Solirubrobacterales bacterium]
MAVETMLRDSRSGGAGVDLESQGGLRSAVEAGTLRLLASGALGVLLISLLVFVNGPSEANETRAWAIAFALALPGGLILAIYQERRLAVAAPAAVARGLAAGVALLALALLLRRTGSGDRLHHAVLAVAAIGALAAPFLAARLWRNPADTENEFARVIGLVSVVFIVLLFIPSAAFRPGNLLPALALTATAMGLLWLWRRVQLSRPVRIGLDVLACVVIPLVVIQLPDLIPYTGNLLVHHLFFLGPANDVAHGRAMLGTAWSQYGYGLIDLLGLSSKVIPLGFGTMVLMIATLTALAYVCVYAILRLVGLGFLLSMLVLAVAVMGNLFATLEAYVVFPSTSPIRFGIPYLIVLCAVLGARFPQREQACRLGALALLALAAAWSFETFVYSAGAYGAIVLVEGFAGGEGAWRRILRGAVVGIAVSVAAFAVFNLVTLALSGHLSWGPYIEYLKLYSTQTTFTAPVVFFSAGPLMGAFLFGSAAVLLWMAWAVPRALPAATRVALAGFTGFAIASFSYYLGRSIPTNLLVLLLPIAAISAIWMQVLLASAGNWWRTGAAAVIALGLAMIAVAAWPSVERKDSTTALALLVPGGQSLGGQVSTLADNPPLNPLTEFAAELLDRYWPPGAPALVLTDPNLTTEILVAAERSNLLPISHIPEDDLIESSDGLVRGAAERVPAGTLMLTSPVPAPGVQPEFLELELIALRVLHRRFKFEPVWQDEFIEVVRLVPRRPHAGPDL